MLEWDAVKDILGRFDLWRKVAAATLVEGLVLGNADMGALIFGQAHRLCFQLSKQNLGFALERRELRRAAADFPAQGIRARALEKACGEPLPEPPPGNWGAKGLLFPCMRMGADLLLRTGQIEAGYIMGALTQRLRLGDALYTAHFPNRWRPEVWPARRSSRGSTTCLRCASSCPTTGQIVAAR
jgi:hypothetical protein